MGVCVCYWVDEWCLWVCVCVCVCVCMYGVHVCTEHQTAGPGESYVSRVRPGLCVFGAAEREVCGVCVRGIYVGG